ncbi:MAG: TonB-dependent receptor [Woeseiaceae bacterium]|nr:TonB-dependent receptor [Woeseiaceae bacterium]
MTPIAGAVFGALNPAGSALAQEQAAERSNEIDEILVTATKRELNLQDVPQSIAVLSAVQLQRMGAKDLEATLKALPSVNLTALQPGQNSLVIRGISSGAYEYRTEAQVAVYFDEQPMTFNSQQVGVRNIDMSRVENLPGPQGTLFGSSSQTGTIRYITNKPVYGGFGGQVEARYGTTKGGEGSWEVNGVLNMPLVDNRLAARLVGYTSHDGGYVDNIYGLSFAGNYDNADLVEDDFNEYDVDGGRLHVLWDLNDKWSTLFTLMGENTTADGVWDTDAALGDYEVVRFEEEIRTDDWYSASMTLSGDLGFADLKFNYSYFDRDIVYEYDNMTYNQFKDRYWGGGLYYELYYAGDPNYVNYPNYPLYNVNYNRSIIFNDQIQQRDTFEFRLVSKGDTRFQWIAGAYYEDILDQWFYGTKVENHLETASWAYAQYLAYFYSYYNPNQVYPLPPTDINYTNELDRTVTQTAVFGEMSYDLTDALTAQFGVRWAEYDRDIASKFTFPQGLIPFGDRYDGDGVFEDVGKESDTIYKFGLRYNVDDDRMLYALYSQGFRVGGANSQRAANTGLIPQTYDSDLVNNYELGVKSQWLDGRLTLNASAFHMNWEDYQTTSGGGFWWLFGIVNASDAETTGLELDARWQLTDRLSFEAKLFMADPKFTENYCSIFEDGVKQPCPVDGSGNVIEDELDIRKGMPMPNSPESTAHASLYYTVPDVWGGDLWFYYDYYYSSKIWNNTSNIVENDRDGIAPSWSSSTFSAGLMLPNDLNLEINVRNLFDQQGYSYVWTGEADNAELFGDPRYRRIRAQERPRTIWFTVRKGFGVR